MDADWKKKWVQALRSGKYKQGHGKLKSIDQNRHSKHCCLGVLGEELAKAGLIPKPEKLEHWDTNHRTRAFMGATDLLPNRVLDLVSLTRTDQSELAMRNDGDHCEDGGFRVWSFSEIADWIETNL